MMGKNLGISSCSVLILAGGLATRLRPITEKIPKALIEVGGRPFVDWQLELLYSQGVRKVVFSVGYLGEMLRDYVLKKYDSSMDIKFVFDGDKLLGTGGAVRKALPQLTDPFIVLYGDSYLPKPPIGDHLSNFDPGKYWAQMSVYHNLGQFDSSNVDFSHGKILDYDKKKKSSKHQYIDWGLSLFSFKAFENLAQDDEIFDLSEVFQHSLRNGKLQGFEVKDRFYEIGTSSGISDLEAYLAENHGD